MARLPDIDQLGARPTPRSDRQIATVRNPGAVAEAVGNLGETVARIGTDRLEREDKLDFAAAKTQVLSADIAARQELENDPDYSTFERRYTDRVNKARATAAGMIRSGSDRRLFEIDSQSDIERGLGEVRRLAQQKRVGTEVGNGLESLRVLKGVGRNAPDDATRESTIRTANEMITGLVAKGLDPIKAAQLKDEWGSGYAEGQVSAAILKGDVTGARATMQRLQPFMSDDAFQRVTRQLDEASDGQRLLADVDTVMAGSSTKPPASVPSLVTTLFPGAVITSTARDPGSALGRANPRSYHNVGRALDVRAIPGVTYDEFIGKLKAAGVPIVEAIDEYKHPSKNATGGHWHVAWRAGSTTAPPETVEDAVARFRAHRPDASPEDLSRARSEIATRFTVAKQAEQEHDEAVTDAAQDALVKNGGNWFALPATLRAAVPAKYHDNMIAFGNSLRAGKNATDPNAYVKLSELAATHPADFARLNPVQYRSLLDDTDWERMVAMRNTILGKTGGDDAPTSIAAIRSVIEPLRKAKGLTTVGLDPKKPRDLAKIQQINGRIYSLEKTLTSDIATWQANNPGKKPSAEDIQKMADRRMVTFTQGEQSVFGFEAHGEGVLAMPAADADRIIRIMKPIMGRYPTGTEVYAAYLAEARQ